MLVLCYMVLVWFWFCDVCMINVYYYFNARGASVLMLPVYIRVQFSIVLGTAFKRPPSSSWGLLSSHTPPLCDILDILFKSSSNPDQQRAVRLIQVTIVGLFILVICQLPLLSKAESLFRCHYYRVRSGS